MRRTRSGISPVLIALAVVVALALVFVIQNTEQAGVQLLFWERQMSVWVAIAIAIGIGILLDRLISTWWRRRHRRVD